MKNAMAEWWSSDKGTLKRSSLPATHTQCPLKEQRPKEALFLCFQLLNQDGARLPSRVRPWPKCATYDDRAERLRSATRSSVPVAGSAVFISTWTLGLLALPVEVDVNPRYHICHGFWGRYSWFCVLGGHWHEQFPFHLQLYIVASWFIMVLLGQEAIEELHSLRARSTCSVADFLLAKVWPNHSFWQLLRIQLPMN